jgi:uncharacterized protein YlxW (UPF0749 family)
VSTRSSRLRAALRPRLRRVDVAVAVLLGLLGFGLAVQVRATGQERRLATARPEDLVRLLDDLSSRSDRLRSEAAALTEARDRLAGSADRQRTAQEQARQRAAVLGVLAGTVPAQGRGVVVTLVDRTGQVGADDLLDAVEELRDAGAEALQVAGTGGAPVRVVASTSFTDAGGGVEVDGTRLRTPYALTVVGDPGTLADALTIPGGLTDSVRQQGGDVRVQTPPTVRVAALHAVRAPRYARPAPAASPGG